MDMNRKKQIFSGVVLGAETLMIGLMSGLSPFASSRAFANSSSVFTYMGMALKNGQTPYVDAFDHKGPLVYLINRLGAGNSYTITWLLELLFLGAAIVAAYFLGCRYAGRVRAAIVTAIAFGSACFWFESGNVTEEYALPFQMASIFLFVGLIDDLDKRAVKKFDVGSALIGLCLGAVLLLKPNMTAVWIVFPVRLFGECIEKKEMKKLVTPGLSFLAGLGTALLPVLIWGIAAGALKGMWESYIKFNFAYAGENTGIKEIFRALFHFCIYTPAAVIAFLYLVYRLIIKKDTKNDLTALLLIIVTYILVIAPGKLSNHYGLSILPTLVYPYAVFLYDSDEKERTRMHMIAGFFVILLLILPFWGRTWKYIGENNAKTENCETDVEAKLIRENTKETDRIAVYGANDTLYVKSGRLSASRYSYQFPIGETDAHVFDEFFEDLNREKPVIVAVRKLYVTDEYMKVDSRILTWIEKNGYEPIQEGKEYIVYGKTPR